MAKTGITDPEEAVRRLNAGEVYISLIKPKWTEKDGIIRFSVTSDGTTGEEWIARLEGKGFRVGDYAKSVLRSQDFQPTSNVNYEVVVLKGDFPIDGSRTSVNIRKKAKRLKFIVPNAEIACLIREKFFDRELETMGLFWIVVMHEPIKNSAHDFVLLGAGRGGDGRSLSSHNADFGIEWGRLNGLAFVFSQVSGS
ncbi:MAG: hypothetical protein WC564_04340 [Patescibacteria group bacterium]